MNDLRRFTHKRILPILAALIFSFPSAAQEVSFLDLTTVEPRVDMRRPAAPPGTDARRSGSFATLPCLHRPSGMPRLRTTLISLDQTHYRIGDEPRFEVKIENIGPSSVQIPFYPHLADLQPQDAAAKFKYRELDVTLWLAAGEDWSSNMGGSVMLYSVSDRPDTAVTLSPGEWVRIVGEGNMLFPADGPDIVRKVPADRMYAATQISDEELLITATQSAGVKKDECVSDVSGGYLPISMSDATP